MILRIRELREAIYDRLAANITSIKITSSPNYNESYPYIFIEEMTVSDDSAKECPHLIIINRIHIWDKRNHTKNIDDLAYAIMTAITTTNSKPGEFAPLTLTSYVVVRQDLSAYNVILDVDPEYRHGVLDIEYWLDEK